MLYYYIQVLVNMLNKQKTLVNPPSMAGFWAGNQDFSKPEITELYFKRPVTKNSVQGHDQTNVLRASESRAARKRSTSLALKFFQFRKSAVFLVECAIRYNDLQRNEPL